MSLLFADYGEGIGNAVAVIRNNAATAGLDAAVPTAPGWTVRDLVRHAGVKLRWASAALGGGDGSEDEAAALADVGEYPDLLDWLDEVAVDTLNDLVSTPAGSEAFFFLEHALESRREAWAQFCAHELTVHGIDAMAARLGAVPRASALWFTSQQAMDGLDQLLRGFVPRWESVFRSMPVERSMAVLPTDAADAVRAAARVSDADIAELRGGWTVHVGPTGARCVLGADEHADAVVIGGAKAVFAALWNRGEEIEVHGDGRVVAEFGDRLRIA